MEKIIWIMEKERNNLLDIQRKINAHGGMRAMCILSAEALLKTIRERISQEGNNSIPSLILIDYAIINENEEVLQQLKSNPKLAGVPLFFTTGEEEDITKEEYYLQGAMVVLKRPVSRNGILRIERAAWQYETTRNYERIFNRQVSELETAKEIQRLNVQLEGRNEFLRRVFGKYFSDELIKVILEKKEGEFVGGDRRDIAVLIADLRAFSSKSEEMSPEEVTDLLNCFFGTMVEIISRHGGTVIEFMGDGILAVFGAPVKNDNYAESAIAAAVAMQNAMQEVNAFCIGKGYQTLEMGIGVHCGEGFVGNVGTEKMMRYNVIGRVVNECSRIEGCSVGGQVLASEDILKIISCDVQVSGRMQIAAKGIRKPISICEVTGIAGEYNCYLAAVERDNWCKSEKEVIFELYPIHNKVIGKDAVVVTLKEFSRHNAFVKILENPYEAAGDEAYDIAMFMDVEVKLKKSTGFSVFSGVYAKIVRMEGRNLELRFTTGIGSLLNLPFI